VEPLPGLGRRAERRKIEVGLIRGAVVKARMWATAIVEVEISADRAAGLADAFISSQIDLLVFDATPQPLNEHVVPPSPLPSMLMAMPWLASRPVNAVPVNCEP